MSLKTSNQPIESVQIDGLAVLKIVKFCYDESSAGSDCVQGILLGLVENKKLEITNCFPIQKGSDDSNDGGFQYDMVKNLKQINIDHLHVGLFHSSFYGAFVNRQFIEQQFHLQTSNPDSVVIIYDPLRTAKGNLSLKALRLNDNIMTLYKEGQFLPENITKDNITFEMIFQEIPIIIKNSHLLNCMVCEIDELTPNQDKHLNLDLATGSVLEKNVQMLIDCVDSLNQDINKYYNFQRSQLKQSQAKQVHIAKRQQENSARSARGEEPLPEEDINKVYKPLIPPQRIDILVTSGQIDNYMSHIDSFTSQSFSKFFMANALHKD